MRSTVSIASFRGAATLFERVREWLRREYERHAQIRDLTRMAQLDNHLLRDIGVNRDDVRYALHQLRRGS